MVENDPLGGQPVEVGRLDPGIAVGTQKAQVQAVANHDDDIHGPDCSRSPVGGSGELTTDHTDYTDGKIR